MKKKVIAIPTQEISMIVQEKLFELGYEWCDGKIFKKYPVENHGKETYLCLNEDKLLTYCDKSYLEENSDDYEKITMHDLFQMESDTIELTTKDGEVIEISRKSLEGLRKLNDKLTKN